MDDKIEIFRRLPYFTTLDETVLERIAEASHEIRFPSGTRFITEGQLDDDVFFIVTGTAEVVHRGRRLRTLSAGDVVGEMAATTFGTRTATVTATTDVAALVLTGEFLRDVMQAFPKVAAVLSREMSFRVG
jgi:CRP-like cAMP-binding protein